MGNMIAALEIKTIRAIMKDDIPLGRGKAGHLDIYSLRVMKDFRSLLEEIRNSGVSPFEVAGEIDMTDPEIQIERARRKSFTQSFRVALRNSIREYDLVGKVEILERAKGSRFFVVGANNA